MHMSMFELTFSGLYGHALSCCRMNALKLAAIFLVVCVALAPLIDALEEEAEEVRVCHKLNSKHIA